MKEISRASQRKNGSQSSKLTLDIEEGRALHKNGLWVYLNTSHFPFVIKENEKGPQQAEVKILQSENKASELLTYR